MRPERQGDDRHVIDALGLDQRLRNARRYFVEVRLDLVMQLDQRGPEFFADVELHGHHGTVAARHGIDVVDALDFRHQPLERIGGQRRDLIGRGAVVREEHVHHRHRDLRGFLARGSSAMEPLPIQLEDARTLSAGSRR